MTLTDRDLAILRFERDRWRNREAKDEVVFDLFGLTPIRYAMTVNALINRPEALVAEPVVVRRLRKLRLQRKGATPPVVDPRQRRARSYRPSTTN